MSEPKIREALEIFREGCASLKFWVLIRRRRIFAEQILKDQIYDRNNNYHTFLGQALDKYVASKPIEDVAADLGLKPEEIIMLVANENPNGMSSKVNKAVATAALNLNRYPDADAYHLQKAIAEKYGVPQDGL